MRCLTIGTVAILALVGVPCSGATTTDAAQTIEKLLTALGPIPWTHTESVQKTCIQLDGPDDGRSGALSAIPCVEPGTVVSKGILKASNIHIIKSEPIVFDPIVRTEAPDHLVTSTAAWANCSEQLTANETETLSVSFQRSSSIAISNSFSHARICSTPV